MKLPVSADNLESLADWIDIVDEERGASGTEVQDDVRRLAAATGVLEMMPRVVCLIGSTKFADVYAEKNLELTLAGAIVLSIGATKSDIELDLSGKYDVKHKLDILHLWKIILADEVYCINVDGYIGASTARELGFAEVIGRPVTFHEPMKRGEIYTVNHDFPQELAEVVPLVRSAVPAEDLGRLNNRTPWVVKSPRYICYLGGCSESVAVKDGKPVLDTDYSHGRIEKIGTGHTWVSDTRGGVTRWFCAATHLVKYDKARHAGRENASVDLRGLVHTRKEDRNAKASALRDPQVEA